MNTGNAILLACCWGSALLFDGIGLWAFRSKAPMNFWAGTRMDPTALTDVHAYNQAYGRLWLGYSLWLWAAGLAGLLGRWWHAAATICVVLIVLACLPGLPLLIVRYRKIEKRYRKKEKA